MTTPTQAAPSADRARYGALSLLFLVYCFNFLDRQVLGILMPGPHGIQASLHLTDSQVGWLGGPPFALFYTTLAIPIAWLADRWNRAWIITVALTGWSIFTSACGYATDFNLLFAGRVGVGVGEAGGVAPSYSLISDYFPPRERARALGAYSFGVPIGSAAGILIGGLIASRLDWRAAFIAVGLAGLVLTPIFRLLVREPQRGRFDAQPAPAKKASFWETATVLAAKPSFWLLSFGAASSSIMGYGVLFWLPSFLVRSYHFTVPEASMYFAAVLLLGGVAGIWLGGSLADKIGQAKRSRYALIPAIAFLFITPCYFMGLLVDTPLIAFPLFLAPAALSLVWLGPVITAVQHLAPAHMRTTASACFLFINNLLGIGLGTLIIGKLSAALTARFAEEALRYSILAGSGFYLIAALLLALAAPHLKRDWID